MSDIEYFCEKCGYKHIFSKKVFRDFGHKFICRNCGHVNDIPEQEKRKSKGNKGFEEG